MICVDSDNDNLIITFEIGDIEAVETSRGVDKDRGAREDGKIWKAIKTDGEIEMHFPVLVFLRLMTGKKISNNFLKMHGGILQRRIDPKKVGYGCSKLCKRKRRKYAKRKRTWKPIPCNRDAGSIWQTIKDSLEKIKRMGGKKDEQSNTDRETYEGS